MRRHLLNEKQPFGQVHEHNCFPGGIEISDNHRNILGKTNPVGNNGFNHAPPIKDSPNASAEAQASAHNDNPFYWSGRPGR
jgi:hypothetical protein